MPLLRLIDPRRRFAAAALLLCSTVLISRLLYVEYWLVNNDNYATLSSFFSSAGHDDYLRTARQFYGASVAACPAADPRCVAYAGALLGEQTYARPIVAFFGSLLADASVLATALDFLTAIARVTVQHVLVSALLATLIALAFLARLPAPLGAYGALALSMFGVVGYLLPEQTPLGSFQPLLGVDGAGALWTLVLAAAALAVCRGRRAAPTAPFVTYCWWAAVAIVAVRVVGYAAPAFYYAAPVFESQVGLPMLLLCAVGIAVAAAAVAAACASAAAPPAACAVAAVLLFGFVTTGENFFVTAFHIASRGQIYFVAAPVLLYAALRPNGPLLWLLPAIALFHVSVAGLLYGCLVASELAASVRRRRPSLALGLGAVLLAASALHTVVTGGNAIVPPEAMSWSGVLARLDVAPFLPGLLPLAVLAALGYLAWRMPDPGGGLLLRAVILAAMMAGAGQLRFGLQAAGFDILDPAVYNFILLSYYLAPAVCAAGIFLVIVAIAAQPAERPASGGAAFDVRALSLLAAAVIALAGAHGGDYVGRPRQPLQAMARGVAMMVTPAPPEAIESLVREAASPDDRYLIGPSAGHAVTMVSMLKMKVRAVTGLLRPEEVEIVIAPQ